MRVILNYPEFGGMYGIKRYALELARALQAEGTDVRLRPSVGREWTIGRRRVGGMITRRTRNWVPVVGKGILHTADFMSNPELRRADVVTVHDVIPLAYPEFGRLSPREEAQHRRALRRALKGQVVTDTAAVKRELVESFGAREERVTPVHLGVNREEFHPAPGGPTASLMKPGMLNVVVAMNADPRKRVDLVLAAALDLPFVRILHAGGANQSARMGPAIEAMMRDAGKLSQEGRYVELGHVDQATLRGLLSNADVYAHPSLAEGFGLPPLEALCCGARVLATDIAPHREVLGSAAKLVAPDAEAMRRALEACWSGTGVREGVFPPLAERLSHAERFTWQRTARETQKVYAETMR